MTRSRTALFSLTLALIGGLVFFAGTAMGRLQLYRLLYISGHKPAQIWAAEAMQGEDPSAALPVIFELLEEGELPVSLIAYDADPCFPDHYGDLDPPLKELPGDVMLLKVALRFCQDPETRGEPALDPDFPDTPLLEDPALLAAFASAADNPNAALRDQVVFALVRARRAKNPLRDQPLDREIRAILERFAGQDPTPEVRGRALFALLGDADEAFLLERLQAENDPKLGRQLIRILDRRLDKDPRALSATQKLAVSRSFIRLWTERARAVLADPELEGLADEIMNGQRSPFSDFFLGRERRADLALLLQIRDQTGPLPRLLIKNLDTYPDGPLPKERQAAALAALTSNDDPELVATLTRYLLLSNSETIPNLFAAGDALLAAPEPTKKLRGAAILSSLLHGPRESEEDFAAAKLEAPFLARLRAHIHDPNPTLRRLCARALASLYPREPRRPLFVELLADPDPEVQLIAAASLASLKYKPESIAPLLFKVLAEEVQELRRRQRRLAALFPDEDLLQDEDEEERWTLEDTSWGDSDRSSTARYALQDLGEAAIPPLMAEIRKAAPDQQDRLLVTLSSLENAQGILAIDRACEGDDALARRARALTQAYVDEDDEDQAWR